MFSTEPDSRASKTPTCPYGPLCSEPHHGVVRPHAIRHRVDQRTLGQVEGSRQRPGSRRSQIRLALVCRQRRKIALPAGFARLEIEALAYRNEQLIVSFSKLPSDSFS